jgi:hypothetical protein
MHPMRRTAHVFPIALVMSGVLAASACTIKSDTTSTTDSGTSVKVTMGSSAPNEVPLAPDDVRIKSIDGVLVLSLIGDTVFMQLSDSLRNKVAADIRNDASKDEDKSGIAALVTKSVAGVVQSAMGFTVRTAARDVRNLRYEDGHIRFDIANGDGTRDAKVRLNTNDGDKSTFTEADARKFIDAVKAKAGTDDIAK